MPAKSSAKAKASDWSYEAAVQEVEAAIAQLEAGELPLAEVFARFEQAVATLQQCEAYLKHRREQVDLLITTLGEH